MRTLLEFVLPRRPLSQQANSTEHKRAWREFVYGRAFAAWRGPPLTEQGLKLTIVYLCEQDPVDINNVIKPIQDAMNSLVYADDSLVTDVSGHLRFLSDPADILGLPPLLADAIIAGVESVYVRVSIADSLQVEVGHV